MKRIAIIHFSPVERYPPTTNWLNFLADELPTGYKVRVYTTHPDRKIYEVFSSSNGGIKIERCGVIRKELRAPVRYWNYFLFYIKTLFSLVVGRPDVVLYYETLSALPALIYKKLFRREACIFVHYHEYITAKEYEEGIPLSKWPHKLEKKAYPKFSWISHTNEDRMRLFLNDNRNILPEQAHILPNYPPKSWNIGQAENPASPLKFVYVGATDLDTMYTVEFAQWIMSQGEKVRWDIYSSNITEEAKDYLAALHTKNIRFMGSVEYSLLPDVLKNYKVGVVLYKGTTLNYVYNVPNKLFEYWACGLDVWFAEELKSSLRLVTDGVFPRIAAVNFRESRNLDENKNVDRTGLGYKSSPYYAENVLPALLEAIRGCDAERKGVKQ